MLCMSDQRVSYVLRYDGETTPRHCVSGRRQSPVSGGWGKGGCPGTNPSLTRCLGLALIAISSLLQLGPWGVVREARGAGYPSNTEWALPSVLGAPLDAPAGDYFLRKDSDTCPLRLLVPVDAQRDVASAPDLSPTHHPGVSPLCLGQCLAGSPEDELCFLCPGALRLGAKTCPRGCLGPSAGTTSSTMPWGGTRMPSWPASLNPTA